MGTIFQVTSAALTVVEFSGLALYCEYTSMGETLHQRNSCLGEICKS